jgi:hypothetical protein
MSVWFISEARAPLNAICAECAGAMAKRRPRKLMSGGLVAGNSMTHPLTYHAFRRYAFDRETALDCC